ncbi:hypothetical protein ABM375_004796 [Salmonella enterica]
MHLSRAWRYETVRIQVRKTDVDLWIKTGIHRLLNRTADADARRTRTCRLRQ